ncbi:MAG: DUF1838 family protein [Rhodospirillaceae bacterium]|nr:DUF1838 family protein [Rhodospirillaceae bacterium]
MPDRSFSPTRRDMLAHSALGFSAATLFAPGLGIAPTAAAATVDLNAPERRMNAVMKLFGATDDRVCFGFVQGLYYGVVDNRMTPLYGVLAAVVNRYAARADGTYDGKTFEVAYFTDWNTGERLETFKNPYTGETVEVPVTRAGPHHIHLGPNGRIIPPGESAGRDVRQAFLPLRVVNDHVWLIEEILAHTPAADGRPGFTLNSVTNWSGRVADVLDPKQAAVPAEVHYNAMVNWRPWLKMGDRPGFLLGNAAGRTVASIDQLPPNYVALTKKLHPDVFEDPKALLGPVGG